MVERCIDTWRNHLLYSNKCQLGIRYLPSTQSENFWQQQKQLCRKIRRNLDHSFRQSRQMRILYYYPPWQTLILRLSSLDKTKCLRYWRKLWNQWIIIGKNSIYTHLWSRHLTKRAPYAQLTICFDAIFLAWRVVSAAWKAPHQRTNIKNKIMFGVMIISSPNLLTHIILFVV